VSVDELRSQEARLEHSTDAGYPPETGKISRPRIREWKRPLLFAVLPIGFVAGLYVFATGGRTITRVAPASCKRRSSSRSAGCP